MTEKPTTFHPSMICRNVLIIVFVVAVAVVVNSETPDYCHGKEFYEKYNGCVCGEEFARKVKSKDARQREDDYDHYHQIIIGTKTRYYVCMPCTMCEDGVRQIAPCWENQNTMCDSKNCEDPNMYFDVGTKSCQPKEESKQIKDSESTTDPTITHDTLGDNTDNAQVLPEVGQDVGSKTESSPMFKVLIVVVCVCSIIIAVVVVLLLVIGIGGVCKRVLRNPSSTSTSTDKIEMNSFTESGDIQSIQSSNV